MMLCFYVSHSSRNSKWEEAMKIHAKLLTSVLLVTTFINSGHATYEGNNETKEFILNRANSFANPCMLSYCGVLSGGLGEDSIAKEHIQSLKIYFDSLLLSGDFNEALQLRGIYERKRIYGCTQAMGRAVDMSESCKASVVRFFNNHIETKSQDYFGKLLTTKQFDEANRLARAYAIKNEAQSVLWLQSVAAAQQQVDQEAARVAARLAVADVADQEKADFNAERTLWQAEKAQKDAMLAQAQAQSKMMPMNFA